MRSSRLLIFGVAALVAAAVILGGRMLRPAAALRSLTVYCGNSMRPAAEELAAEFQRREGVFVEFTFGGSETLFPQVKLRKEGDVFICHDPFGADLQKEGLLERSAVVGYLDPAIIVAKGNPKKVGSLKDLVAPGLRVGTTDPRYATCGEMVEAKLREHGWAKSYTDCPSFVMQTRSHADVATALIAGQLDAGVVWNFVAQQFEDKVDGISTGESFPETRVTFCLLPFSKERRAAERFLDLAESDFGRGVFASYGYARLNAAPGDGAAGHD